MYTHIKILNEAIEVIRDECNLHSVCIDCPFYSNGCSLETNPYNWEEVDNGEE